MLIYNIFISLSSLNVYVMIKPKPIKTYAGMLSQQELAQRYSYLHARIEAGYTAEELSFLIGRAPYYFKDYESMEDGALLKDQDQEMLAHIFKGTLIEAISFEKDEFYGYCDKRLVRVILFEDMDRRYYEIRHPWLTRNKKRKTNEAIRVYECLKKMIPKQKEKTNRELKYLVTRLCQRGFFKEPKLPWDIFVEVKKLVSRNVLVCPVDLKEVLYAALAEGKILMKTIAGRMHYQS